MQRAAAALFFSSLGTSTAFSAGSSWMLLGGFSIEASIDRRVTTMATVFCPTALDAFPAISFRLSPEESIADSVLRDAKEDAAQAVVVIRRIEEANELQASTADYDFGATLDRRAASTGT
jgi:hypothetical protein